MFMSKENKQNTTMAMHDWQIWAKITIQEHDDSRHVWNKEYEGKTALYCLLWKSDTQQEIQFLQLLTPLHSCSRIAPTDQHFPYPIVAWSYTRAPMHSINWLRLCCKLLFLWYFLWRGQKPLGRLHLLVLWYSCFECVLWPFRLGRHDQFCARVRFCRDDLRLLR